MSFQDIATLGGIPIHEETHQEDFSYSLTLFEKECLPTPSLLLHTSVIPLAVILSILVVMILMAAKVTQLRLLVCERFFPGPTEARVEYLHAKILKKRLKKRPLKVTSPYSKVGVADIPSCKCLNTVGHFFCFPLPAAFLVSSDLQAQRDSTNYRVRRLYFIFSLFKGQLKYLAMDSANTDADSDVPFAASWTVGDF